MQLLLETSRGTFPLQTFATTDPLQWPPLIRVYASDGSCGIPFCLQSLRLEAWGEMETKD